VTIVTDNAGPFRSFRFEAFIATHPEIRHVRTRVRSPGQNGSRDRPVEIHLGLADPRVPDFPEPEILPTA
jgi:putative transposase